MKNEKHITELLYNIITYKPSACGSSSTAYLPKSNADIKYYLKKK